MLLTLPPQNAKGQSELLVNGVPYWKAKPISRSWGNRSSG